MDVNRFYKELFISIHAPRVGSDSLSHCVFVLFWISIHAPRVGSDQHWRELMGENNISIHAPRVGSDPIQQSLMPGIADFNPRSPCGERPVT